MKLNTILPKHNVSLDDITAATEKTGKVGTSFEFTECFAHQKTFIEIFETAVQLAYRAREE